MDFVFLIGGEAGQGIQSAGYLMAKTLVKAGLLVFADQDFESRIRGGHNFFRIRISNTGSQAVSEDLDFVIALNSETIRLHESELKRNGIIIHDSNVNEGFSSGLRHFGIPFDKLAKESAGNKIMRNTVALGAALAFVSLDLKFLESVLEIGFRNKGETIVRGNLNAAKAGYSFAVDHYKDNFMRSLGSAKKNTKMLLNGIEGIAIGALASDCRFMSGYPMTPSSGILHFFASKSKDMNVVFEHAEDEIAALNMVLGASYAGVRSMTATSGGGFSLMVEALSLAGMTETPVVIVLGQRPGPATGLPTRTEQGELSFALSAGHGFFPRAIFAPSNAQECFFLITKAFNLAEKYQIPVIVITDQFLSDSYFTLNPFDLSLVKIDRGDILSEKQLAKIGKYNYLRHKITDSGVSPRVFPGVKNALVVTDSDEHTEDGHITESARVRDKMVKKRLAKLEGLRNEISAPIVEGPKNAQHVMVSWGSTLGALKEAVDLLNNQGSPVRMIHFSEIWPFPSQIFISQLGVFKELIVVESNATGQLANLISAQTGLKDIRRLLRYDGRPISPRYIVENFNRRV